MNLLEKIPNWFKTNIRHPKVLETVAKALVEGPFYSPKKDKDTLDRMKDKFEKGGEVTSKFLEEMSNVAIRLYFFYMKKESYEGMELSLLMTSTLKNAMQQVESGELNFSTYERSRIEALTEYWEEIFSRQSAIISKIEESKIKKKAESYFRNGKSDEAIRDLQVTLKAKKKTKDTAGRVATLREIAEVYKEKGNLKKSVKYFEKAAKIDPLVWFDVGSIYSEMRHFIKSIKAYKKFLEKVPDSSYAWNNIGWAHENLRHFQKALECYEKALTLNKSLILSGERKGWLLWSKGEIDQAIKAYEDILKIEPKTSFALTNLTAIYNDELHDYEKAANYATRNFEANPNNIAARSNLAEILVSAGRYKDARHHAKKVLEIDDDPSRRLAMYFVLACSYSLEGNTNRGTEYLNTLIAYYKSLPETFRNDWIYDGISNLINKSDMQDVNKNKLLDAIRIIRQF